MASKNSIKQYIENGYYHLYNRGVEKRTIFQDEQDYSVFLSYLKGYLTPKDILGFQKRLTDPNIHYKEREQILRLLRLNNFSEEITLLAFCLMPNHFHLLVKQKSSSTIDTFMNSLLVRYVMYFNKKYKRVGPLFQDVYKAVVVESESQLLYLTSYIHRNPLSIFSKGVSLQTALRSQPSSYLNYLGLRKTAWIKPEEILAYFSKTNSHLSYQSFVEQTENFDFIENFIIDN